MLYASVITLNPFIKKKTRIGSKTEGLAAKLNRSRISVLGCSERGKCCTFIYLWIFTVIWILFLVVALWCVIVRFLFSVKYSIVSFNCRIGTFQHYFIRLNYFMVHFIVYRLCVYVVGCACACVFFLTVKIYPTCIPNVLPNVYITIVSCIIIKSKAIHPGQHHANKHCNDSRQTLTTITFIGQWDVKYCVPVNFRCVNFIA